MDADDKVAASGQAGGSRCEHSRRCDIRGTLRLGGPACSTLNGCFGETRPSGLGRKLTLNRLNKVDTRGIRASSQLPSHHGYPDNASTNCRGEMTGDWRGGCSTSAWSPVTRTQLG